MKTLVTHINPHLDDIAAIWLLRKFDPQFKEANLEFISASNNRALTEETVDKIFVGTGGGKFDEHTKDDISQCATTLVWDYLREKKLVKDEIEQKALDEIAQWSRLIDTGKFPEVEYGDFSIQAFIRPLDNTEKSSKEAVLLGEQILDRVLGVLTRKQQSFKDWEARTEFQSSFGKSIAVKSETINRPFCNQMGGDLFLMVDPKTWGVQYFSQQKDLEPIYAKLRIEDPAAEWFLHQSHHMVLCGSGADPDAKRTKLTFEQLIEVAKSV